MSQASSPAAMDAPPQPDGGLPFCLQPARCRGLFSYWRHHRYAPAPWLVPDSHARYQVRHARWRIAADVHGKNHHKDGSFRVCVDWIDLMGPDGEIRQCSRQDDAILFDHTPGGMGLTGIILRAAIRLRRVETAWDPTDEHYLKAAMSAFETAQDATYSVAWLNCLGTGNNFRRSLVTLGEHTTRRDLSPEQAQAPFRFKPK